MNQTRLLTGWRLFILPRYFAFGVLSLGPLQPHHSLTKTIGNILLPRSVLAIVGYILRTSAHLRRLRQSGSNQWSQHPEATSSSLIPLCQTAGTCGCELTPWAMAVRQVEAVLDHV